MNLPTRRDLAVVGSAILATAAFAPSVQAAPAASAEGASAVCDVLSPVDALVVDALNALDPDADVPAVLDLACVDTPDELGAVLAGASPSQVSQVLAALPAGETGPALDTLDPGDLAAVVGGLAPAEIRALATDPQGLVAVVQGLREVVAGVLADAPPVASAVDGILLQVEALLAGGLPADPAAQAALDALLAQVAPLLATTGADPSGLWDLAVTLQHAVAGSPAAQLPGVSALIEAFRAVFAAGSGSGGAGGDGGGSGGGSPSGSGGGSGAGAGAGEGEGEGQGGGGKASRRATVKGRNVKGRVARVRVTCPAASRRCVVALRAKVGGRTAAEEVTRVTVAAGATKVVELRLTKRATRELEARGGRLRITATTRGAARGAATGMEVRKRR